MPHLNFAVIVPTLNAAPDLKKFIPALQAQSVKPKRFLVIDSASDDGTAAQLQGAGAEVVVIERKDFNHGGTRMLGARKIAADCDVAVFLTQDAILSDPTAIETLVSAFKDPHISAAYGRQLPREKATLIETFARNFNYPETSQTRSKEDIATYGFRTCFCSNSFAAYRLSSLIDAGGFPEDTIFGEDALAVGKMILNGATIQYEANAAVIHSHSYSLAQEFRRYFDIGVMHSRSQELLKHFGSPSGAGREFVLKEFGFLLRRNPLRIPEAFIRTALKYTAYKLGRAEKKIGLGLKRSLSMHKGFWQP